MKRNQEDDQLKEQAPVGKFCSGSPHCHGRHNRVSMEFLPLQTLSVLTPNSFRAALRSFHVSIHEYPLASDIALPQPRRDVALSDQSPISLVSPTRLSNLATLKYLSATELLSHYTQALGNETKELATLLSWVLAALPLLAFPGGLISCMSSDCQSLSTPRCYHPLHGETISDRKHQADTLGWITSYFLDMAWSCQAERGVLFLKTSDTTHIDTTDPVSLPSSPSMLFVKIHNQKDLQSVSSQRVSSNNFPIPPTAPGTSPPFWDPFMHVVPCI